MKQIIIQRQLYGKPFSDEKNICYEAAWFGDSVIHARNVFMLKHCCIDGTVSAVTEKDWYGVKTLLEEHGYESCVIDFNPIDVEAGVVIISEEYQ